MLMLNNIEDLFKNYQYGQQLYQRQNQNGLFLILFFQSGILLLTEQSKTRIKLEQRLTYLEPTHSRLKFLQLAQMLASVKVSSWRSQGLPFALPQSPTGNDPERHHEDQQHRSWTDRHQSLQDEPGVEIDPVECANRTGRSIGEQFRV